MPGPLAALGMQAGQQAVGAGMGLILQGGQDRRQLRQQQKLQNMEIQGQKQMTDYNYGKQLQLWNDTNYGAQMEQLKNAGLNPGLIYGMGGGGGQTTQIAQGHVTAGQAPKGGGEAMGMGIAMGNMQLQLLEAQKENIQADTQNKQADVPVKGAQVPNIQADTALKGSQKENLDTQQGIIAVQRAIAEATQNMEIAKITYGTEADLKRLEILRNDKEISDATKLDKVKQVTANLANTILDNALKRAQTDKQRQEINNLKQQWDINSMDQKMATAGMNPNAGSLYKMVHSLLRGIKIMFTGKE